MTMYTVKPEYLDLWDTRVDSVLLYEDVCRHAREWNTTARKLLNQLDKVHFANVYVARRDMPCRSCEYDIAVCDTLEDALRAIKSDRAGLVKSEIESSTWSVSRYYLCVITTPKAAYDKALEYDYLGDPVAYAEYVGD